MKKCRFYTSFILLLLFAFCLSPAAFAQTGKISGVVTDETNTPVIGAVVKVIGTSIVTATDIDGKYSITLPAGKNQLEFTYIGLDTQTITASSGVINVRMTTKSHELTDVVVIGYGTTRKSDLTGSVSNVSSKDFNSGLISSPEQLINGKVSGVQIMSNSGSPTAGSTIRVRGGASLNASNDPLIVVDGMPLEAGGISGNSSNFLSLINPSDIESMTILKDASSTAIYGSRASNGVIIITTKKGTGTGLKLTASSTNSIQTRTKLADMLTRDQFTDIIRAQGTAAQQALLGTSNTDWNNEIYRPAFGTDNNVSLAGRIGSKLPVRLSIGYYNQNGLVKTDNAKRLTGSMTLSPYFFNDDLKLTFNVKGSLNNNRFPNTGAIWAANVYNPTLPVYSGTNAYGGYTEALDNSGNPVNGGVRNPLGLLNQYKSTSDVKRIIGNFDVDYKFRFLPELKFHTTLGYDYAQGQGNIYESADAAETYTTGGRDYTYGPQKSINRLLTTYFNYNKTFDAIRSNIDATAGYDYQFWKTTMPAYTVLNTLGDTQSSTAEKDERHALISYYGRLNYTFMDRYVLTTTVRSDGTSRFNPNNRWGVFPSVALAWKMNEESFLKDVKALSNLKLRTSFGITGQQEGIGNYNYIPVYTISQNGAQVLFGDQYYYSYRPQAYVENLKWETTSSWNFGVDFGFLDNKITGSFDYYTRKTKDLLATVPSPAGVNFSKNILTNVGNVKSRGWELTLNATPISNKDFTWDVSYNMSWQKQEVTNLSLVKGGAVTNTLVGPNIDSYQFQVLTEGYAPNMFYVYHQLYDANTGKPIEGAYADINNDGQINSSDLYHFHSPTPDYIFGLSTSLRYKKWRLATSLRANLGNYVYNGVAMNTGAWSTVSYNSFQLNNLNKDYLYTGFQNRQYLSDYYVRNASFIKMDNLSLAYTFNKYLSMTAMVQNVFTITKYNGVDPEVPNGMDLSFYPRPRTFSMNLAFTF